MPGITRLADLDPEQITEVFGAATRAAVKRAFDAGVPVTGSCEGRRKRYYPNGRIEDLGPVAKLPVS
jgi:hypothetical protein